MMDRTELLAQYRETRALSVELCRPLKPEDYRIQSMPDVSPPWWNLGHTSWFFARNILEPFGRQLPEDSRLEYALNSYYEALGPRLARDHRGLVTRPTTDEVYRFRHSVDERIEALLADLDAAELPRLAFLVHTGIQHEQQHQELLVTEIKHILGSNIPELREPYLAVPAAGGATGQAAPAAVPGQPAGGAAVPGQPAGGAVPNQPAGAAVPSQAQGAAVPSAARPEPLRFFPFRGGVLQFGNLEGGWCWDNELPVHTAYLDDFALADRLVTNGEYLEFIEAGGYADALLWLSNGWGRVRDQGWSAPLYWERDAAAGWRLWTLGGLRDLDLAEPVSHVSFYEADAFARFQARRGGEWAGTRLPTEREWEHAARQAGFPGAAANFLDSGALHPRPAHAARPAGQLAQLGGDLWEWTTNHYEPYPGYQPFAGALMEYNGKFMDNQRVLRGGSCATPANHIRPSYRNFWPADARFQFTGIRLARGGG
jgi:formylglycine-generating enzyme required for sulfatase activity